MKALRLNNFVSDVLKLVAGTGGGRIILFAALPVATRLYSPDDFALLAVYMALTNSIAVAACLRLELAIPLAEDDTDAAHLLVMSLISAGAVAVLLFAIVTLIPGNVAGWIGTPAIAPYLWLVAVGVALAASYSALQFWATRARRFGMIARTRVGQAATGAATMLGFGWLGIAPLGLLVGTMLTVGAGGGSLLVQALRHDCAKLRAVTRSGMSDTLRRFKRYPLFSTPEGLANIAGIQVPILIIASLSTSEAGQLFLAMQIMAAPMVLLGASIAQVYISRAPEENAKGTLGPFTLGIVRHMLLLGVGPLCVLGLLAPFVMPPVFGAEWRLSGTLMSYMVPWMALQFLASPISLVMMATGRQAQMLLLTLLGGVSRISAVVIAYALEAKFLAPAYIVASALFYLVCLAIFSHAAGALRLPGARPLALALVSGLAAYGLILQQIQG